MYGRRVRAAALCLLVALPAVAWADELVVIEPAEPAPREAVGWRAGPAELEVGALVQLDAARGGARPGYSLRRARARLAARMEKVLHLGLRLQAELSPLADPRGLLDALIELRIASRGLPDLGRIALGQMKVPFSAEVLDAPEDLPFLDRADGTQHAPVRDIGLRYDLPLLRGAEPVVLCFGLFNGEGAGALGGGGLQLGDAARQFVGLPAVVGGGEQIQQVGEGAGALGDGGPQLSYPRG